METKEYKQVKDKQIKVKTIYDDKYIYITPSAYQDRIDVNFNTSLYEYGIVRNKKTNRTIIGLEVDEVGYYTMFMDTYITPDDLKQVLLLQEDGFFDYVGSTREEYVDYNGDNLVHAIHSLNMYNGWYRN